MNEVLSLIEENIKKLREKEIYTAVKYEGRLKELIKMIEILNEEIKSELLKENEDI